MKRGRVYWRWFRHRFRRRWLRVVQPLPHEVERRYRWSGYAGSILAVGLLWGLVAGHQAAGDRAGKIVRRVPHQVIVETVRPGGVAGVIQIGRGRVVTRGGVRLFAPGPLAVQPKRLLVRRPSSALPRGFVPWSRWNL